MSLNFPSKLSVDTRCMTSLCVPPQAVTLGNAIARFSTRENVQVNEGNEAEGPPAAPTSRDRTVAVKLPK